MQQSTRRRIAVGAALLGLLVMVTWQMFSSLRGRHGLDPEPAAPADSELAAGTAEAPPARPPLEVERLRSRDDADVPSAAPPAPAPTGAIDGILVTADRRSPVPGAAVAVRDPRGQVLATVHTAVDGAFALADLPPGYHELVFAFADERMHAPPLPIHMTAGGHLDLGAIRVYRGVIVSGRVVDGTTGDVMAAARVEAFQPAFPAGDGAAGHQAFTASDGRFRLIGPFGAGELILSATTAHHASRSPHVRVNLGDEDVPTVEIRVFRTYDLHGTVLDADRAPVTARVELIGGGRWLCCADAGFDGTFVIGDVLGKLGLAEAAEFAPVFVRAANDRLRPGVAETTVARIEAGVPLEIVLERGATIRGRCITLAGNPLVDVTVTAYPDSDDRYRSVRTVQTGRDGTFELSGLSGGPMLVEPAARVVNLVPDLRNTSRHLNPTDQLDDVVFVYRTGQPIAGTAVDSKDGEPLVDRLVTVHHADWLYAQETLTDQDGAFAFPALPDGRYTVALRGRSWQERRPPVVLDDVQAGVETLRFEVDEEPEDGVLELRLVDAASGQPVTGDATFEVRYHRFGLLHRESHMRAPDAAGLVVFDHLPRARYQIDASAHGYALARAEAIIAAAMAEVSATLHLVRAIAIHGRITDAHGTPIAGAWARAFDQPEPGELRPSSGALSDGDGRFTLTDASPHATAIAAAAAGFAALRVDLPQGGVTRFQAIALGTGAPLAGVALYPDGTPAAMVEIVLAGAVASQYATTDLAGRFTFDHVEDGAFEVQRSDGEVLGAGEIVDGQGLFIEVTL